MKKRLLALSLAIALCLTPALAAGVEDKFPPVKEYPGYADVPSGIWFETNAKLCYETGLITGSDKGFEPYREMTVAEVAAIAARICEAVTGELIPFATPKAGETLPWYFSYVEYLKSHGVTGLENPEATATRGKFLDILAAVLPDELLAPINTVSALPDCTDGKVIKFYNAGILTGTDKYGTFAGDKSLTRAEGAAMVSRVVRDNLRTVFSPADYAVFTAARLAPADVLFEGSGKTVTAEDYLSRVLSLILALEDAARLSGEEFNWFLTVGEQTFLDYVKSESLLQLGVTKAMGTQLYQNFDVQVFYSRYLDLKETVA